MFLGAYFVLLIQMKSLQKRISVIEKIKSR
jgi:hypothetical protein